MKNSIFILLVSVIITGCLSMPDPVKDEFLVEQTNEETQHMDDIAQVIIAKRKEKDAVEEKLKVTRQQLVIAKKELPVLKDERKLLLEKQKLYTLQNDETRLSEINGKIAKNEKQRLQQEAYIDYLKALEDDQKAGMELKHAELAVKVAELNFVKAQIARRYQEKNLPQAASQKEEGTKEDTGKSLINVKTYEDYYVKQQELLKKKKENKKKSLESLNEAKKALNTSGYTGKIL